MLLPYNCTSVCIQVVGSMLLLIVVVEVYLLYANLAVGSHADSLLLPVGQNDSLSFNNLADAFQRWDAHKGCAAFRATYEADLRWNRSRPQTLQDPDAISCTELKKPYVSVLVRAWTWIPDSLNNLYSCKCGLTCQWTKSAILADNPDAWLYETILAPGRRKKGEPLWVYMDLEPGRHQAYTQDLFVTYHARDDLQATYAGNSFHSVRNYYVSPIKDQDVLIYWSSSRCVPERQQIAESFLAHVAHHSFGRCLNNMGGLHREIEIYPECELSGDKDHQWSHVLHCTMSHYKFVLAIENTMTESYVTEKLFYALDAGSVPIYFGAPNVWDFVPPNSIIDGSKFSSLESLASYVKQVASDPILYAEYHAWRHCGVMGNYHWARAVSLDTLPCRLCSYISKIGSRGA